MNLFGEHIKKLREAKGLLQKDVAIKLDIDTPMLSKIERGERKAKKEHLAILSKMFGTDEEELITLWLAGQVYEIIKDEDVALKAMQVAEKEFTYNTSSKTFNRQSIISRIREYFVKDGRVEKAWIFGSFARGDDKPESDIDLMVKYSEKASGTLLDYADIQYKLQLILKRKIDLVEEGYVTPFAWSSVQKDIILIYG